MEPDVITVEPGDDAPGDDSPPDAPGDFLPAETLIEDVSIDGMCGVY